MAKENTQFITIDANIYTAIYNGIKLKFDLDETGEIVTFNPVSSLNNNVFYENIKEKILNETRVNLGESFLRDFLYQHEIHDKNCSKINGPVRYASCKIFHDKWARFKESNLDALCYYAFNKSFAVWRIGFTLNLKEDQNREEKISQERIITSESTPNSIIINDYEKIDNSPKYNYSKIRLYFIVLFTMISVSILITTNINNKSSNLIENNCVFNVSDTTSLKILILPFKPDIKCKELDIDYKGQIIERLSTKKAEEGLSIKILSDLCSTTLGCPVTNEDADRLGEAVNADIVIWGSYEENSKGLDGVRIKYKLLTNFYVDKNFYKGDSEMKSIKDLHQLRNGYLQHDIDYLIYWFSGISAHKQKNYRKSLSYFNIISSKFAKDKYEYHTNLRLGEIYYDLSAPDSSIMHYQIAFNKMKSANILTRIDLAKIYANIAANYIHKGIYSKAESLLNYALSIQLKEKAFLGNDISKTYKIIGQLNLYQGNFVSALSNFKKSLKLLINTPQNNNYEQNICYLNIANASIQLYRLDSASYYARKVLSNEDSSSLPLSCGAYYTLGTVFGRRGDNDSAIFYYHKSLKIQNKLFTLNNPLLVTTYTNLGAAYAQKGDIENALKYFEVALRIKIASNNKNDLIEAYLYSNTGSLYISDKQYNKALEYLFKAEKIVNSLSISKKHILLGDINLNLAEAHSAIGENTLAKMRISKAIEIYNFNNYDEKVHEFVEAKRIAEKIDRKLKSDKL